MGIQWSVHGERCLYESEWVKLCLADVEVPGHRRFEHHVVRVPCEAAGTVVHDPGRGLLLMWRHRFITDTWGWEVPAGRVDPGETPQEAASRETLEETGWRPRALRRLFTYQPANGLLDQRFNIYMADGADHVGQPTDISEASRIEWLPVEEVKGVISSGQMVDGLSLTAVLYALTFTLML
ncbi:MAG TPA: NUDIX hydrolase [Acidimicrobiales bacterium]|nr:NUDIX hydrolase [Acidimicrobiales bacterium]